MKNLISKTIKNYQILLKIRETGSRILYRAFDTEAKRYIGFEVIKVAIADKSELYGLLNQQAIKNAELSHPNIAVVIDSGIAEDFIFFVYNFSPFHTLRRFFNRTFPWRESARELVAIAQALTYAHENGIIHGSINPTSVVIDENKNPFLFDFGFEQIIIHYVAAHFPGSWINNWDFAYCSPEQIVGDAVDARSDVYGMGMILYEWMTDDIAFLKHTALETLYERKVSSIQGLNLKKVVIPEIKTLIQKSIDPNPNQRYQSMQELTILLARGALDFDITLKMVKQPLFVLVSRSFKKTLPIILTLILSVTIVVILGAAIVAGLFFGVDIKNMVRLSSLEQIPAVSQVSTALPMQVATIRVPTATLSFTPTPTTEVAIAEQNNTISFPIFEGMPLPSLNNVISPDNSNQLITLGLWGIGETNRLTISPDGNYFVVGSSRGVFIYDSKEFQLKKFLDTSSWVSAIEYSLDGKVLAVGDRDGLIRLWDTDFWAELENYSGHRAGILDMAFSPDGNHLVSIALDNTLIQWERNSKDNLTPVINHGSGLNCVVYSSDGNSIITGGNDFKINFWDAKTVSIIKKPITFSSKVFDMAVINNSNYLVVGGSDRRVTIIDTDGVNTFNPMVGLQNALAAVAASQNGDILAGGDTNGGILVWNKNGALLWKIPRLDSFVPFDNPLGSNQSLLFSPDGKTLISGLRDGTVRVFNAATGDEIQKDQSLNNRANRLAVSHDSKLAISQNTNGMLKVWDLYKNKLLYELPGGMKPGGVFSMDDRYFAVASDDSTVKVYKTLDGQEIHTFHGHQNIATIQFLHNDTYLAAGFSQMLHLWSLSSFQEIKTIKNYSVNGCTIVYDLNKIPIFYITKYDHVVIDETNQRGFCSYQRVDWMKAFVINEFNGRIVYGGNSKLGVFDARSSNTANVEMNGVNRQIIVGVAINPEGNLLAVAFDDNSIRFWDITTRQEVMKLYGHDKSITDLQFTPDGKILLSSSLDGTIRLWAVPN